CTFTIDELGIPHDEEKQLWGAKLTIIGYEVDPNEMTISMQMMLASTSLRHSDLCKNGLSELSDYFKLGGWIMGIERISLLRSGLSTLVSSRATHPLNLISSWARILVFLPVCNPFPDGSN
ncbi:hypothetical protein BDZ97DRAFT_1839863, partial [Flammula alnicola]